MEINIKKVLKTIYKFDFTKLPPIITHGSEFFVSDNGISEFNQTFKKQDLDNGIVVTPSGYTIEAGVSTYEAVTKTIEEFSPVRIDSYTLPQL